MVDQCEVKRLLVNLGPGLGINELNLCLGQFDNVTSSRSNRLALGADFLVLLLGFTLCFIAGLNAHEEVFMASRFPQMLESHMESLGQNLVPHSLVQDHTNASLPYVEHLPCLPTIVLMWHTRMLGAIDDDIHVVTHMVVDEHSAHWVLSMSPKRAREQAPGPCF